MLVPREFKALSAAAAAEQGRLLQRQMLPHDDKSWSDLNHKGWGPLYPEVLRQLWEKIAAGKVKETNFDSYRLMRINEAPAVEVYFIESEEKPGGMGEPVVALVAPAVCNAIYAATRKRLRALPIAKQGITV